MILFVTGTDTGVGKTVVTAALAAAYAARGRAVCVVKPAQTGVGPDEPGDLQEVRRLAGTVTTVEPVRLPDPLAPDLAARVAGVRLPGLCEQRDHLLRAAEAHDVVLVEGAGGVTVNLGETFTLLDVATMVAERAPVAFVVAARPGLGTLNHSALTVWAVQHRGHHVAGLVLGSWPEDPQLVERLNRDELPLVTGVPVLGAVPLGAPRLAPADFRARAADWFDVLPDEP